MVRTINKTNSEAEFYTPREVARMLGVGVKAIHARIREGKLEACQFTERGCLRIPRSQITQA